MTTTTKRLADLSRGDIIEIDRAGHHGTVTKIEPSGYRADLLSTSFLMDDGRMGGWDGHADSIIRVVCA